MRTLLKIMASAVFIALGSFPGFAETDSYSSMTIEVPTGMLLWPENSIDETEIRMKFGLTDVKSTDASLRLDKKVINIDTQKSFSIGYEGILKYETFMQPEGSSAQGRAVRFYGSDCSVNRTTSQLEIMAKDPSNIFKRIWDNCRCKGPSVNEDQWDLIDKSFWKGYKIFRLKSGAQEQIEKEYAPIFEVLDSISGRHFVFDWETPEDIKKAKLKVTVAKATNQDTWIPDETLSVPEDVRELIRRESCMLYKAMFGGKVRKDGEIWELDGKTLAGMIHPSLEACFSGRAIVQATKFTAETPLNPRIPKFNGTRLAFLGSGDVDGRKVFSSLKCDMKTMNGSSHSVEMPFGENDVSGEIWLDEDRQMIRYAILKIPNVRYEGDMPKIGSGVAVEGKVNGRVCLIVEYINTRKKEK